MTETNDEPLTCEYCSKPSTGERPNPGHEQPGYVWYFDNEEAAGLLLNDPNIPYGEYHVKCHDIKRRSMSTGEMRDNFVVEASHYASPAPMERLRAAENP